MGLNAIVLSFLILYGAASVPIEKNDSKNRAADHNYMLNTVIRPSDYVISLKPYFETGNKTTEFKFDGQVRITVQSPLTNISQIKLHSQDLTYTSSDVSVTSLTGIVIPISNITFDKYYTFVYIDLTTSLQPNIPYYVDITFVGNLQNDMKGFYKSYYLENGEKKWLAATQMQPGHARKAFPCFDEPEFKTTFSVTIYRPTNYKQSLSNTKLQNSENQGNGYTKETFYPTPLMSTYLVAFMVSEFEAGNYLASANGKEFGVWTRPQAKNNTAWAFDVGQRIVDSLSNYTAYDYYSSSQYLKLDHVGIPDFSAGAMENWGLVKYRESAIAFDEQESTSYFRQRIAVIIAHETTHMWFGNLVTCHWWSDAWLNEGFATYFEYITSHDVEPTLGMLDQFVSGALHTALAEAQTGDTVPITNNNVYSPAEVSAHFGTVTYSKAGSVIRMIKNWIGEDAFQFGLRSYLNARKFDTTTPEDLYSALQSGTDLNNGTGEYNVSRVMGSWVSQAGYPYLQVDVDFTNSTITLTQKRFYVNPEQSSSELYIIPMTYTTGASADFENTKPAFLLTESSHSFQLENLGHTYVIFNIQQTGVYRVNYDNHAWEHIYEELQSINRTKIHKYNRAQIVDDVFNLALADKISYAVAFNVLNTLILEREYVVWTPAIIGFQTLRSRFSNNPDSLKSLNEYILKLLEEVIKDVGFEVKDGETNLRKRNRMQIIEFACELGHQGCIDQSVSYLTGLVTNNTAVPADLRPTVYCFGLKEGNGKDYDYLYQRYVTHNVNNEQLVILGSLGCTSDHDKIKSFLQEIISENSTIRSQDSNTALTSALRNPDNFDVALKFVKDNYSSFKSKYGSISTVLSSFLSRTTNREVLNDISLWIAACSDCSTAEKDSVASAVKNQESKISWTETHIDDINKQFGNGALTIVPSYIGMLAMFIIVMIQL